MGLYNIQNDIVTNGSNEGLSPKIGQLHYSNYVGFCDLPYTCEFFCCAIMIITVKYAQDQLHISLTPKQ